MTAREHDEQIAAANAAIAAAEALLPWSGTHPVGRVRWVHLDDVRANDYNPNAVASHEMRLLHTSIAADGYTQPVVTVEDDEHPGRYVIVDGFHRYTVMRTQRDVYETTGGYLPIVVIDKPLADRIAATVRHNRARGKHSVTGMGTLVFEMLSEGKSDAEVCNDLGLEPEELARLKHITGFAVLHKDHDYARPVLTQRQVDLKRTYKAANPDEHVPNHI